MSPRGPSRLFIYFVFFVSLLPSGSGCSSVRSSGALPFLSEAKQQDEAASTEQLCTVEMRGVGSKSKTVTVPLTEEMRVTDLLKASKAGKRYPRADVHIWRKSPLKAHEMVKLDVRFDRESGQVKYDTDYAIHPNDRVVVVERPFSIFDEAYNSLLGPILGHIGRR